MKIKEVYAVMDSEDYGGYTIDSLWSTMEMAQARFDEIIAEGRYKKDKYNQYRWGANQLEIIEFVLDGQNI